MTRFDTIVVVDWSGGNDTGPTPRKDAVWAAVIRAGQVEPSKYLRNRVEAEAWLADLFSDEINAGRRMFAGFDFPFGYPNGFAARLTGKEDPLAVWDWYAAHLEDTPKANNRFALAGRINESLHSTGPFWFNGTKVDQPGLPRRKHERAGDHRLAERRLCERHAKGAFTCWQMGGAGAVGSQIMTGMAVLSRLRTRFVHKISAWPFEPLRAPIALVEVWPSLHADAVRAAEQPGDIRDEVQVRTLAARIARMQDDGRLSGVLADVPADARREEGWIFGLRTTDAACEAA
ncbi:MAG: molybdopterin guanine dinucleotide synthesis [Albidovulum sp.]